jgi:ribosomal protein S27AE
VSGRKVQRKEDQCKKCGNMAIAVTRIDQADSGTSW